jgi:hypothetical protein
MKKIQTFTSITLTFHKMHNTKGMLMKIIMQKKKVAHKYA